MAVAKKRGNTIIVVYGNDEDDPRAKIFSFQKGKESTAEMRPLIGFIRQLQAQKVRHIWLFSVAGEIDIATLIKGDKNAN
jgi:hypothetical protein